MRSDFYTALIFTEFDNPVQAATEPQNFCLNKNGAAFARPASSRSQPDYEEQRLCRTRSESSSPPQRPPKRKDGALRPGHTRVLLVTT
jgi:hypothetical protein